MKTLTIGEIAVVQTGPFGSQLHSSDYIAKGIPSIMPTNIINDKISETGIARISTENASRLSKYLVQEGDIVFSRRGDIERKAFITKAQEGWLCGTGCLRVRVNKKIAEPFFVNLFLSQQKIKDVIKSKAVGTTMLNLNTKIFSDLKITLPEIGIQKEVCHLIKTIDLKTNNLNSYNDCISSLALSLFKKLLLDANETNDVSFIHSIVTERTQKINISNQKEYKVLSAVSSGQLIPSEDYFSKQVFSKDLSKYKILEQFDFAYNPARVNIGSIGMLDKPIKGCVSPVYTVFRAKPNWHYFIDLMIKQPHIRKTIEVYCSGSVRQVLRFEDFCRIEIKLPPEKKVLEFNEVYQRILSKINHNKQQIEKLAALRESILPRLMSGKVEIKN